jgi:ribosomal protection tetracycline resistance protein
MSAARTIYRETPVGVGEVVETIDPLGPNKFVATVGLRLEPGPPGSGVRYQIEVELGSLPRAFHTAVEDSVHQALRHGRYGWEVTDCVVTLTRSGFASPVSTAADFRGVVPVLVARALDRTGVRVLEPISHVELLVPPDTLGPVLDMLGETGASVESMCAESGRLDGVTPTERVPGLYRRLTSLTHGEGLLLAQFSGYRPITGPPPANAVPGCVAGC